MPEIIIDNQTIQESFLEHLNNRDNKRILFSGAFGAGKSFFLKEYFQKHPTYIKINLFPVDYPVGANEDILETIKFDILNELLDEHGPDLDIQDKDFSAFLLVQMYMMHKMDYFSIAKKMIRSLLPAGEQTVDTAEGAKEVIDKYSDYKNKLTQTDQDIASEYLAAAKAKKGSIREQDSITMLIREFIQRLKNKHQLSTVLIIDDLDRLDPDHVFRILNIFTAHYDSQLESNKFGFDQVILVCDIDTLRHLFHHRYGSHANFNGFIDKFYSTRPFIFNNRKFLIEKIEELMKTKGNMVPDGSHDRLSVGYINSYGRRTDFYQAFMNILTSFIEQGQLKIRNFERFSAYYLPNYSFTPFPRQSQNANVYQFLVLIHLLRQFFVGLQELKNALEVLKERFDASYNVDTNAFYSEDNYDERLISISLPFLIDDRIVFKRKKRDVEYLPISILNEFGREIYCCYRIEERDDYWDSGVVYLGCKDVLEETSYLQRPNPFVFLLKALDTCMAKGFIS